MNLSTQQQATLDEALAVIAVVGPVLGPNGALAATLVSAGAAAIKAADTAGVDVTDDQLEAMFDQFDVNKADDLKAQAEAAASEVKPS